AWVRVDLPAELFMYYGGEPLDDDPETVWQGFHAVWHVDDVLIGRDSAGSFDLIDVSGPPAAVDGVVGRGAELEESNENIGDSMCAPGSFKLTALSSFSYSLWVKRGVQIGEFDMPFDAGGNSRVYGGFSIEIGLADWKAGIADEVDIGYSLVPIGGSNNEWQHLAVSLERGTPSMIRTYLDGISAQSVMTTEGDITTTEPICLGGRYKFTGQVDEARIHDGALGAEWYAAEFVTADPQYLDFGPQEDVAP
ncbi:MAG TPA: LamG-like jellyroll fold domain-containing protein, partial [Kofleriaceae bacterium]